jgi:protein-S-isoprenylcysteine O-methyltransferase Ste14
MLRESVALLVLGVTIALVCGVPLARDEHGEISELSFVVMWYLMIAGMLVAGLGALLFWLEVLR